MPLRPPIDAGEAVYLQIARVFEGEIGAGYKSGDFLPPEQVLSQRFGVNRHTLRRAVDELIDAGVVERRRGRGTMVLDPAITFPIRSRTRFTETLESQGKGTDTRLIFAREAAATVGVAQELRLREGDPVVWLEVLRLVDQWPFSVASIFMPCPRFAQLVDTYDGGSLHEHLERLYGVVPQRARSLITAVMPRTEDAHALKTPRNRPLMRVKSTNIDPSTRRPVEYCVTRIRSDRCQLEVSP